MRILVTGANGFVGLPLAKYLTTAGHEVVGVVRSHKSLIAANHQIDFKVIGDIDGGTDWQSCLNNVECVIHLANRAHVMHDQSINPLTLYREVNTNGTLNLARQAAAAGVRRFIFISSVKVNRDSTSLGEALSADEKYVPVDPYGLSKYEAEMGLQLIAKQTGLEVVVIRPPLIYGPRVKGNFLKMMAWVEKGIPLPFGAVHNLRSLLGLDNLINFIELCLMHRSAVGKTFLISDDYDVSTTELLVEISSMMRRPLRLLPIPKSFIKIILLMLGQRQAVKRLCCSLRLDITLAKTCLSWKPPYSFKDQLSKTVFDYLSKDQRKYSDS
jgi:nucleoside-diphosphate-sugar epimerase